MANPRHEVSTAFYKMTFDVGPNQKGVRLDAFLKDYYRRRSRTQIQKAIEDGSISVHRSQGAHLTVGRLKASSPLVPGDVVEVMTERKPEPAVSFDYRVLHEDESLFVITKPANLPVHPAGRYFFNTLLVHLRTAGFTLPLKAEREFYLPHRIDKETSGILVLTKDRESCAKLTEQFAKRETRKRYLAVVRGRVEKDEQLIELPIQRATHLTTSVIELKMIPMKVEDGGLPSQTLVRRLSTHGNFTLVECHPKTGRQHQIRCHLDAIGHPIVGDKLYGLPDEEALRFFERERLTPEAEAKLLLPRHALHSYWIEFKHPTTGKLVSYESPLPEDLRTFLNQQG